MKVVTDLQRIPKGARVRIVADVGGCWEGDSRNERKNKNVGQEGIVLGFYIQNRMFYRVGFDDDTAAFFDPLELEQIL